MLRSPKGNCISQMYQYEPKFDITSLSQQEYNLVVLLMSVAGKLATPELKYGMNGMMQSLFPDGAAAASELQTRGWATTAVTLQMAIEAKSGSELKSLLREKGLEVSGTKAALVERLLPVLTDAEKEAVTRSAIFWQPTSLGFEYIRSLYAEREAMESLALEAFQAKDFKKGTRIIRAYAERFPVSGAITGDDFSYITQDAKLLTNFFSDKEMNQLSAIACFEYSSGSKMMFPPVHVAKALDLKQEIELDIRYKKALISNSRDIESYKDARIEYCQIYARLDACTCTQCILHDKTTVLVQQASLCNNFPPFHKGCRCLTVAFFPKDNIVSGTRFARDPLTGEGYYVPASYTFIDWYDSLTIEQRQRIPPETREAVEEQLKNRRA